MNKLISPFSSLKYVLPFFVLFFFSIDASSRTLLFQSENENVVSASGAKPQLAPQPMNTQIEVAPLTVSQPSGAADLSANAELFFMIEQLQQEVNTLRGLLEEQSNELRMLKQSGKDRYVDLDTRILDLNKRVGSSSNDLGKSATALSMNLPATEEGIPAELPKKTFDEPLPINNEAKKQKEPSKKETEDYQQAYSFIKDKKFDDAIIALFNYTENHPESPLLPNVYYWLGEVYLATAKLDQAKTSFLLVINAYPTSQKASDATYKLGITLDGLGDKESAKKYLQEVQDKYPNSSAAKLASNYKLK